MSALAVGALLLGGPAISPQVAQGSPVAGVSTTVESRAAVAASVPAGLRRPGHEGIKARMHGTFLMGRIVSVDVNPTLPGSQSYKVKLQVKRNGKWVTCAVKRTTNVERTTWTWAVRGSRPHEMTYFVVGQACPGKAKKASRFRIVLKAQHGFERTVSRVRWVPRDVVDDALGEYR